MKIVSVFAYQHQLSTVASASALSGRVPNSRASRGKFSVAHYGEYIAHVRPCLESTVVGLKFCYCGHCSLELENTCDELKNLF